MSDSIVTGTWDPVWDKIFRSQEWGKYPPEHLIRFIARNFYSVSDRRAIRLLEIGCGPGANVWFMAREGFSVSGIDGSPTAVQQANARLASEGLMADLRVGDFTELPWADATFDGVVEWVSLVCNPISAIEHALNEVDRVLKPGAPFLSSFFSDKTWGYGLGEMIDRDGFTNITEGPLANKGYCLFLNRDRVSELFRRFTDTNVERVSWTLGGERHLIEQLVVTCSKSAS
jgi:SAM-dependent methyltransferase